MLKNLKLLFLLGAFLSMPAGGGTTTPDYTALLNGLNSVENAECDLEAPATLTVDETGTSYIAISWSDDAHAFAYNVRVWEYENGPVPKLIVDAKPVHGTHYVASHLKYSRKYRFEVAPMCDEVNVSRKFNWIEDNTLIIDLVVEGYTALPGMKMVPQSCNSMTINYNPAQPEYKWFDVEKTVGSQTKISRYTVWVTNENGEFKLKIQKVPESFYSGNSWPSLYRNENDQDPPCAAYFVSIIDDPHDVCQIDLANFDPPFVIYFSILRPGYAVKCLIPYKLPTGGEGVDSRANDSDTDTATFVTNPFSDNLHITSAAQPAETAVTFNLIDSNGRVVLEEQRPAAQEYDLPTSQFPSGFYILKIGANQNTQTFKVIKF